MTSPARQAAHEVLCRIELQGAHSDDALRISSVERLEEKDRNLVTAIVYGTLRWRAQVDFVLAAASSRPWSEVDNTVRVILRMSLYQMWRMDRVPDYAVVSDAVDLTRSRGPRGAAGFVNAVLRNAGRLRRWSDPDFEASMPLANRASLPDWLWNRWASRYGEEAAMRYALSLNEQPRPAFRFFGCPGPSVSRPDNIPSEIVPGAFFPARGSPPPDGYAMDEASQLVPFLLGARPGWRIWDACAAPGGKSSILLELAGKAGVVVSSDSSCERAASMKETIESAGLGAGYKDSVLVADARRPPFLRPFDAVVVDAPCSGLGTLRRNPEIKWRMPEDRLSQHRAVQIGIMLSASDCVAPGGRLLYSTCSTEPEENEEVISRFLASRPEFQLLRPDTPAGVGPWVDRRGLVRTFPEARVWDGFFAALLARP